MKASRLILFFGVLFFVGCVTPNKIRNKADLDKIIISNLEKELIFGDTIIFESFPLWCGNTNFQERLAYFEPIENDSNFMLEIEKQFSQKIYFSNIKLNSTIDSSSYFFEYEGGYRKRSDFNNIMINGKSISRRKIRVLETYFTDSSKRRFDKIYQYRKGKWELVFKGERKQK